MLESMMASTRSTERRKIYIAVMGVTGAGKSTFIRTASGLEGVDVGHDLKSCERGWTNRFEWLTQKRHHRHISLQLHSRK